MYFFSRQKPEDVRFRTPTISGAIRGTEFTIEVGENGGTEVALIEGEVALAQADRELVLHAGERAIAENSNHLAKEPLLNARNVIQWVLYYPAILDPAEAEAGGLAYKLTPKHALAQIAATGCLSNTYYSDADAQLDAVVQLVEQVDDNLFLAKLALYARERALMKDMPAALTLALSKRDRELFKKVFPRTIDNGRVLHRIVRTDGSYCSANDARVHFSWPESLSVTRLEIALPGKPMVSVEPPAACSIVSGKICVRSS